MTSTGGPRSSGKPSRARSPAPCAPLDPALGLVHHRRIAQRSSTTERLSERRLREWLADDAQYPHTDSYELDTLTPSPALAGRLAALRALPLPPWFWHGEPGSTLLSIGTGKAYFERAHWGSFDRIHVVDPSPMVREALERFPIGNVAVAGTSLFELDPRETTATHAWLGASSHHVFAEFRGWEFLEKLALLVSGTVVVDGGVFDFESRSGRDLESRWTKRGPLDMYRKTQFSFAAFGERAAGLWDVARSWPTPWAPERRTVVLERVLPPPVERSSLGPLETIRVAEGWAVHRTPRGFYRECSTIDTLLVYDTVSKLMGWDLVLARVEDGGRFVGLLTRDCGRELPPDAGTGERLHLALASRLLPLGLLPVDLARENIRLVGGRPVCIDIEVRGLSRLDARTALASVTNLYKQYEPMPPDLGGAAARIHGLARRARGARRIGETPLVWSAPLFDTSGYAEEARQFVLALDDAGVDVHADPVVWNRWQARLSSGVAERLERLLALGPPDSFVHVVHTTPHTFVRHPQAVRSIGRTMLETDGVPPEWVARCNEMDEIWVPSAFNLETFARAGVAEERLRRVPEPIRRQLYDPLPPPLLPEGASGFTFLCVLAWGLRKGWDVLVRAYCEEFTQQDDVTLVLKADTPPGRTGAAVAAELEGYLRDELGREPGSSPRIILLLDRALSDEELVRLYRGADCYVMPSRGEGWGRTYMEAMAAGLPTIGTRWSGNLEFMTDENAYLVDCSLVDVPEAGWEEAPAFRGHRWAEPSLQQLRSLMRRVYADPGAAATGARAREDVLSRFSGQRVAEAVAPLLRAGGVRRSRTRRPFGRGLRITWEGDQFAEHSLAIVNRDLCRALLGTGRVDLGLVCDAPVTDDPSLAALAARVGPVPDADVHVRHAWPPDFEPPEEGRFVLIQPWEYGSVPAEWVERIEAVVDELWVPSRYVRDCYVRSGVAPGRVAVVPNGVDPILFNPGVPSAGLPTDKRFRFLFVGGTLARKGADLLLEAYLDAFGPGDDVCLVVKDFGSDSFYRGQGLGEEIRRLAADPGSADVLHLDGTLPRHAMGGLFRACHCLVHPYRGEGFALPIAEAMACGLPVVATAHGACLDFCDPSTAYLLPAREVQLPAREVGGLKTVDRPWWAEPDRDALARTLRYVYEHPGEAAEVGRRAGIHATRELAWRRAADVALERLDALAGATPVRRARRGRSTSVSAPAPGLTLCVIARDEEEHIGACLESVRGIADQAVVVDTGSTDRTVEVARRHGAEVHELDWDGDFAAARNEALGRARHAWILVLDADERLERESYDELRSLIASAHRAGYLLRMLSYLDREGRRSVLEHPNLRLFPNDSDVRYEGRDPHSQVVYRGDGELPLVETSVVVHHEGYRPQVFEAKRKGERNLGYLERAVLEHPHDPFHAFNLGVTYGVLGRNAEAEQMLLRSIALQLPGVLDGRPPAYLVGAYRSLALALFRQARFAEAGAYAERALALAPELADAHVVAGAARSRTGDLDGALACYERALSSDGAGPEATDRSSSTWKPLLGIGEVRLLQQRWQDALAALDQASALAPGEPGILVARAHALVRLGRAEEAERALESAITADAVEPDAWVLLAEARLLGGRREEAEQALRDGLFRHPEAEVLFGVLDRLSAAGRSLE